MHPCFSALLGHKHFGMCKHKHDLEAKTATTIKKNEDDEGKTPLTWHKRYTMEMVEKKKNLLGILF